MNKFLSVVFVFLILLFSAGSLFSQPLKMAPLLPETETDLPPGCGFIPPRMDLSHLTGQKLPPTKSALVPPESFDWRDSSVVTSVKNQGSCGSCYAFTSIANIEAKVLVDGGASFDFSENNAKECNYSGSSCSGGNFYEVANLVTQKGVVLETCDPYAASDVACNSSCSYIKTLLGWNIICSDNIPSTAVLQDYIQNNGPVYTTMYAGNGDAWDTEFGGYNGSYTLYYAGSEATNHAVLIVGWDNSLVHAGGTGGWIVKNSWGSGWGDNGYFTIAYGSANIGQWSSFAGDWKDFNSNETISYYDEAGWTSEFGAGNTTSWGLSSFTPAENVYLLRVEFWTTDITTDVDVYIYDGFNGSTLNGLLASQLNLSYSEAGYHSVLLDAPPEITSGNEIFAVVKFTNASYGYPVAVDVVGPAEPGKTYMSINGSTWYDMGGDYNVDVAVRVRTVPTFAVSVDDEEDGLPEGFSLSHNYPNPFNPGTTINYSIGYGTEIELSVYNALGQKIATLVDEPQAPGDYTIQWNGRDSNGREMSSGIYFYKLETGLYSESKKMVLLK
ncbi:MAG: T9SS type A sorting domain-containing protein [candidate division Zixibacteria bacterium]|nr:T9SS type A sorting domain-containing protein [candidate division Zixibacteria bacterium]